MTHPWIDWLEGRWVVPAYGGGVLLGIGLSFFGAATNTMSGWLYVLSGAIFSLLILGIILPIRSLKVLQLERSPLNPVSVGQILRVEIILKNPSKRAQNLFEIKDILPTAFGASRKTAIEMILPNNDQVWRYELDAQRRGIFHWETIELRTAAPLGLFWCRRDRHLPGKAVIYPQVLPLTRCPIVDSLGQENSLKLQSDRLYQNATEGITKSLRPYRVGDPTRLIHWRSSARLGELQVRELEIITGGEEVLICLDSQLAWQPEAFEQAVTTAASLYFYALRCQLNAKLWLPTMGILQGRQVILEALAAVQFEADLSLEKMPVSPQILLTQNVQLLNTLPKGSRWIFFNNEASDVSPQLDRFGLIIDGKNEQDSLQTQLQRRMG